ncbi:uncharacterized protein [Venturia canescens]|uniref:uncharacterized protein isoform X2 n=1 Tax=Venturia canescens TaxID=32260 RepID=UPI001C9D13D2|nr:uncharacterized protein LOC122411141 isoform X2 [Venturia canescens]
MARAGTQRWRNPAPEGDDVQRSIELLDKVLSEYDEHESADNDFGSLVVGSGGGDDGSGGGGGGLGGGGSGAGGNNVSNNGVDGISRSLVEARSDVLVEATDAGEDCGSSTEPSIGLTPDDESPSLGTGGHQSEDDGYMSMNGRKAKMALVALRPVPDCPEPLQETTSGPVVSSSLLPVTTQEFPPPPEEAERIISTLLPMVSPNNSSKRTSVKSSSLRQSGRRDQTGGSRSNANSVRDSENSVSSSLQHQRGIHDPATSQTTLPKTRHRRPYGWWERRGESVERSSGGSQTGRNSIEKFSSLPYDARVVSYDWIPGIVANSGRTNTTRSAPINNHRYLQHNSSQQPQQQQQQNQRLYNHSQHHHHHHNNHHSHYHQQSEKRREANSSRRRRRRSTEDIDLKSRNHNRINDSPETDDKLSSKDNDLNPDDELDDDRARIPNEMSKSSSAEECGRMIATRAIESRSDRVNGAESDSSEARFSERRRNSVSGRSSIPRSSSVSVERFSMRANYGGGDSSDFSRANSTSNERFNSDFSLAVASASSNDRVSVPSSDPFSLRNLDFVSLSLLGQRADSSERFSDVYSTRNSDFSTRNSTDFRTQSEEEERFSDDSLEELLPAPGPPIAKRHSIAWEVSLEEDPLYAPGSTKVVGRRRRRSSDVSSAGSISKLRDFDDWQDPRQSTTDDDLVSPYSDSSTNDLDRINPRDLSKSGTYVIRRGRKRERKPLVPKIVSPTETKSLSSFGSRELDRRLTDACGKRFSTTFDDIKSLLREGRLEGLDEPPPDFVPPAPPNLVRVVPRSAVDDDDDEDEEGDEEADADAEADNDEDDIDHVDSGNSRRRVSQKSERRDKADDNVLPRLPPSPLDEREEEDEEEEHEDEEESAKIRALEKSSGPCNGAPPVKGRNSVTTSKSLDISTNFSRDREIGLIGGNVTSAIYTGSRRSSRKSVAADRTEGKIPVNILIEDQIVKKALNENRRQLERVSDEIKEIESVKKNSEAYNADDINKRTRKTNVDSRTTNDLLIASKRNSYEAPDTSNENSRKRINERISQNQPLLPSTSVINSSSLNSRDADIRGNNMQNSLDSETSKTSSSGSESADFDRPPRRSTTNGCKSSKTDIFYSSDRKISKHQLQNGQILENRKIDHKEIENVIDAILEDSKNPDFQVSVEVLEFPPLPPSPVEEADEESSDVGNGPVSTQTTSTKIKPRQTTRTMDGYRPRVPPHRGGLSIIDGKDHSQSSLDTRSMDAGFPRGRRTTNIGSSSRREIPVERRTLPTDLPGPSRRRAMTTKRQSPSTDGTVDCGTGGSATGSVAPGGSTLGTTVLGVGCPGSGMQTSCSLPETPVFARGSDVPRTPQHAGNPTQPRRQPGWYAPTTATTGYRRNNPCMEQAIIGTELLRLAGGPNRGWYPTRKGANQPRPASIEHLERLNSAYESRLPGSSGDQRKPLTLPTNITPNKYFGQRGGSKESTGKSGKDNVSPSGPYPGVSEPNDAPKKKGFFKSFWKRSRHYSLENQ